MDEDKVEITYDVKPFIEAMNKATTSFDKFSKNLSHSSDKTTKKSVENTKKITSAIRLWSIANSLIVLGINKIKQVLSYIPEFGKTLSIAGDIIVRNLLYPLRLYLLPYLQQLLDWTRQNRVMFVKFGGVLVNVFRLIKVAFVGAFSVIKAFIDSFAKSITDLFQVSQMNVIDTFNLVIFKITALLMILQNKLEPFAEFLGKFWARVIKDVADFVSGFGKGFAKMFKAFEVPKAAKASWESFKQIFKELEPLIKLIEGSLKAIGKLVGEIFGATFAIGMITLSTTLKDIVNLIKVAKGTMTLEDFGHNSKENWDSAFSQMGKGFKGTNTDEAQDFVMQDGKVQKFSSQDTIIGAKKPMTNNSQVQINVNLNVTEGNAKNAGMQFVQGMTPTFKSIFMDQLVAEGGK